MMQLARRASLVVVLLLLSLVGKASAECAWVLWAKTPVNQPWWAFWKSPDPWSMVGAMPTDTACMAALREAQSRSARLWTKFFKNTDAKESVVDTERRGNITISEKTGPGILERKVLDTTDFQCLPDTVDPRGPKARQ